MYSKLKLVVCFLAIFMVETIFGQDTLFVEQLSYIDSSATSFQMGVRPLVVDNSNTASFFYTSRGTTTDSVFLITSGNFGQSWSTPEIVSTHDHPDNNKYFAQGPTAAIDDSGYIHVVYPTRGAPLYVSGWDNYPPSHINYVTNESGGWVTSADVINDDAIQTADGNGATVSYLYYPAILSLNNMEYFASYDYAWWSTKSHVVYSERGANGIWTEGSALVTYERNAIDKYTIYTSTIVTDQTNIHSLWFNRFTGELKSITNSAGVWGAEEVIHTSSYAIDGVINIYSMSPISGNGKSTVVMSRRENNNECFELFFAENDGVNWSVETTSIPDTLTSVTAFEKNDTTNIFYRCYRPNDISCRYKFLTHTDNGFSNPVTVSFGENNNVYNVITAEHYSDPLIYQYYDKDKAMWYLCSGKIGDLVITGIEDSRNNIPADYSLKQNYPNPFNPETVIEFNIPESGITELSIYNSLGEEVDILLNSYLTRGSYRIKFDGSRLSSGVYFYLLRSKENLITKKMLLLK